MDDTKSQSNKDKHGIDFVEVQALWVDPDRLEIPARTEDEELFLLMAKREGKHWSAVVTYREERVRIISVRRSRREEVGYEGK